MDIYLTSVEEARMFQTTLEGDLRSWGALAALPRPFVYETDPPDEPLDLLFLYQSIHELLTTWQELELVDVEPSPNYLINLAYAETFIDGIDSRIAAAALRKYLMVLADKATTEHKRVDVEHCCRLVAPLFWNDERRESILSGDYGRYTLRIRDDFDYWVSLWF